MRLSGQISHYEILSAAADPAVYKARDKDADRLVALRVVEPCSPERAQRIRQAVAGAAALSHPNLARVYEFAESDGQRFLVTELVEGESLDSILKRERLHRRDL